MPSHQAWNFGGPFLDLRYYELEVYISYYYRLILECYCPACLHRE